MSSLHRKLALFILKCALLFHFNGFFYLLMPEDHFLVLFFTLHAFFHEIFCPISNVCPILKCVRSFHFCLVFNLFDLLFMKYLSLSH